MSRHMQRRGPRPPRGGAPCAESHALPETALEMASRVDARSLKLCAQAQRALEFALAGECRDASLHELSVVAVLPDPTARRLRVWLRGPADMSEEDRGRILRGLSSARGFLRAQVAARIHRKRTPELAFELLCGVDDDDGGTR